MTTFVVVNERGAFFAGYRAILAPTHPCDDDTFEVLPQWETEWSAAHVFETRRGAERFVRRHGGAIAIEAGGGP